MAKKKQIFISIGSEDKKNLLPGIINKLKKEIINYDIKIHLPTIKKKINKTNQAKYLKDFIESEYCIVNKFLIVFQKHLNSIDIDIKILMVNEYCILNLNFSNLHLRIKTLSSNHY